MVKTNLVGGRLGGSGLRAWLVAAAGLASVLGTPCAAGPLLVREAAPAELTSPGRSNFVRDTYTFHFDG
jgi:hypothetical protein